MKKATISPQSFEPALPKLAPETIAVVSPMPIPTPKPALTETVGNLASALMGIGLYQAESEPGQGSRFWVELPARERLQDGS